MAALLFHRSKVIN
jgi:hypothetical protein